MRKIYLILIISAIVTVAWYLFLFSRTIGVGGACMCLPDTENTYHGPDWPELIPSGGCGNCHSTPPSEFFSQLLVILLPAIVILSGYGAYEGIRKLISRNR
jgi:hypothetical protein